MNFMTKDDFIKESNVEIIQKLMKKTMDILLQKNLQILTLVEIIYSL